MAPELKRTAAQETIYESGLPLPWVNYPGQNWPWLSVQEEETTQPYFCSCTRPAVISFLDWNETEQRFRMPRGCIDRLNLLLFGAPLQRSKLTLSRGQSIENSPIFRDGCCHLCSGHMPLRAFPGGIILETHFGWYVGLELIAETGDMFSSDAESRMRARRRVCLRLGLGNQNNIDREDALAFTVRGICSAREEILRNARPTWLGGLELDLLLPRRRLAIEFQGIQHKEPIDYFGGERAYVGLLENDQKKQQLCEANHVAIEYFDDQDPLTESHVRWRLGHYFEAEHGLPDQWPKVRLQPTGPEWEALSRKHQFDTLCQIWLIEEMEYAVDKRELAVQTAAKNVAENYIRRWGASVENRGGVLSSSLLRKYYRARKLGAGRRWQDFCRYRTLIKERTDSLREQGLTPDVARAILRANGGVIAWAKVNEFPPARVRSLLDQRAGDREWNDRVASAIFRSFLAYKKERETEILKVKADLALSEKRLRKLRDELKAVNADLTA